MTQATIAPFKEKLARPLTKSKITVLQINLGKRCNLACTHCHVEASPKRTEELLPEICQQLIEVIQRFPQIQTVDLTGGAPEMNYGFKPLVEAARSENKEVIVRSNLTIFFVPGFTDLPEYFAQNKLRVVASLPCYLEDNVDRMRGTGVYQSSIQALQKLNELGYGRQPELSLDLIFNPQVPQTNRFSLTPEQQKLEQDYKLFLREHFNIEFNQLLSITNLPIGRTKFQLEKYKIHKDYLAFLESHFNPTTIDRLMCRNELSVDYLGNIFDCDFNQMENLPARMPNGEVLTVAKLLEIGRLDVLEEVQTAPYCYGCTAGCGSSCGGALI